MEPGRSAETGDDHGAAADLVEASPQGVAAAGFSEDDKTRRTETTSVRDRQSETQGLRTHKERRTGHTTAADQIDLPLGRGPDPAPSCELEQRLTWTYTVRGGPVGGPAIARAAGAARGSQPLCLRLRSRRLGVRIPPGALCVETDDHAPDQRRRRRGPCSFTDAHQLHRPSRDCLRGSAVGMR